ncbi:ribulose phosphate epimerase [Paraliomyxa miuraensis]|uniref:ribulose phosphate epimerase n=1 Tax=Paraliomyxa miuraensis TaxID=376150 RepID=UPI002258D3F4|nr:ribulose phosphate epimerase [Paraliomyxa miuraensis]MCX4242261.1 ribulose phosphate epimerase [Paraliomyxa miuraensis]
MRRGIETLGWVVGMAVSGACGSPATPGDSGESASTGADEGTTFGGEGGSGQVLTTGPNATSTGPDTPADSSGDDVSFLLPPDGGGANECDPTAQDCPMGQKCTAWANDGGNFWNATRCVEVMGGNQPGDSCMVEGSGVSGIDDCDAGGICLNTNEENIGVCIAFCMGEQLECGTGDACAVYNDGVLPLCLPGCDPLLQDCPPGQSCIDTPNQTFICFLDASGSGGADGDACPPADGENSCDPGQWCGPGSFGCDAGNCCTPYCDLGAPDCIAPDECVSFFGDPEAAPPGFENVGVCVLP